MPKHLMILFGWLRNGKRGAVAMEFALILPIFSVMICGVLQYGVLFYTWNVALNGARNAARSVAVGRSSAEDGETLMKNALPPWVGGENIAADVTDAAVGGEVVATMSFPSRDATFVPLAPMPEDVSVTVRMVKEA